MQLKYSHDATMSMVLRGSFSQLSSANAFDCYKIIEEVSTKEKTKLGSANEERIEWLGKGLLIQIINNSFDTNHQLFYAANSNKIHWMVSTLKTDIFFSSLLLCLSHSAMVCYNLQQPYADTRNVYRKMRE